MMQRGGGRVFPMKDEEKTTAEDGITESYAVQYRVP